MMMMMMMMMMAFSHKGGGDKDTPRSPRYWLPYTIRFQAFRSWGRRKEIWAEKKKNREAYIIIISFTLIFSFLLHKVTGSLAT